MKKLVLLSLCLSLYFSGNAGGMPPIITSFSPTSGPIDTTVIITGSGFSIIADDNIVYFGALKATVSLSTADSITVSVPAGAGSVVPVTVTVGGLVAYSVTSTTPTFNLTNTPILDPSFKLGNFEAGTHPISVAIGEFNGDGKPDMVVANGITDNTVSIMLGNGVGTFAAATNYTVGNNPKSVAIGDFNGDGIADLAVANTDGLTVSILLGIGNGTFADGTNFTVGTTPQSVAVGDFNRDGIADLAVANYGSATVSILLGNGAGSFAAKTDFTVGVKPYSVAIGDFNGDGKADLVTTNYNDNNVSVLLGNGNGTFAAKTDFTVGTNPMSVAIGDFDGNGSADLAVANVEDNNVSILLGDGAGSFATKTDFTVGAGPVSVAIGDFDGDGIGDMAVANSEDNTVSILLGNGAGSFAPTINMTVGSNPESVVVGDFNMDGKADLASTNFSSKNVSVLLFAIPPIITSFTPVSGTIETTVTISGTNFSSTPADNIVYFGALKAIVSASTETSITVTVPAGAGSVVPVTVTVGGLVAYSTTSATPTFNLTNTPVLDLSYAKSTFEVGNAPESVAISDFNGDGRADLAVANYDENTITILFGAGDGSFGDAAKLTVDSNPESIAIGDFDGDGISDLAVANGNTISIFLGIGNGSSDVKTDFDVGSNPYSIAIGDFNGDGKADLAATNCANTLSISLGNGDGTFGVASSYAVGSFAMSIAVGDINNDGIADIAVANYSDNNVSIFLGNGDGTFGVATNFAVGNNPNSVAIGDFNKDGKADLAVANDIDNTVSILLGNGEGGFGTATNYDVGLYPYSVVVGDFNGDGNTDLAAGTGGVKSISILLGDGEGSFSPKLDFGIGRYPSSVAVGDFNGDGKADMVMTHTNDDNLNTISILIIAPPVAPLATSATNVTSTAFTANWNVSTGATKYYLDVATDKLFTIMIEDYTDLDVSNVLTYSVSGLSAGITYYYRVRAYNNNGTSTNSNIMLSPPLEITSFSPTTGTIGTTVTITGTSFSNIPADNIVYFGAVKATVSESTTTSITVTVPSGAGSIVPVSVTVDGFVAYSATSTTPTFNLTNTPILVPNYATSTVEVGSYPNSVAIGDFDGDGKTDIAVVNNEDGGVSILLGNADGSFADKSDYGVGTNPYSFAIGDFNGDGNADLAVANYDDNSVSILLGNGNGTFEDATYYPVGESPNSIAIGDFNSDGNADLVVVNDSELGTVSIVLGNGDGSFGTSTNVAVGLYPVSVAVGDFNKDGKTDIAVVNNEDGTVSILLGNGDGSFVAATPANVGSNPVAVAVGDFNGDGKADLAVANGSGNTVSILLGNGESSIFVAATNFDVGNYPYSVAIGDFNGDGKADIATANSIDETVSILLGNGAGSFAAATNVTVGANPVAVAVGDFNGDGKADLAVANQGDASVSVLLYETLTLTWTGDTDTDWNTAGNWDGGIVPTSATDVYISSDPGNQPIISATTQASCNNLTVDSDYGASLTIQSSVSGTGSLIISGTSTGTVTAERYMTGNIWHMVSPITVGDSVSTFIQATGNAIALSGSNYGMMDYNETTNTWNTYYDATTPDTLSSGKGYSVRRTSDGIVTFTGELTSGTKSVQLSMGGMGWNCIGNPYTSAINMNDAANGTYNFLKSNSSALDGSYACMYVWDDANLSYKILGNANYGGRDLGQNIFQSGQGFFVKAASDGVIVEFNNNMQVYQTGAMFKAPASKTSWPGITLTATSTAKSSSAIIAFHENMTNGLDPTYDAGLLRGNNGLSLYTRLLEDNGVDFAVQCLPENYNDLVIPVGVDCKAGGEITFSAETVDLPTDCNVVLEDKTTGILTSLTGGGSYKVILAAETSGIGRFYIRTADNVATGTSELTAGIGSLKAYNVNGTIIIEGEVNDQAIATLYDLQGIKVLVHQLQKGSFNTILCSELTTGVYLLTIQQKGETTVCRKLIMK